MRMLSNKVYFIVGVLGAVRSPLHVILSFLRPTDSKLPSPALMTCPHLAESAFRLIYSLTLNNQTSEPILRFLRLDDHMCSIRRRKQFSNHYFINFMKELKF
jgi:hypothetical protein